MLPAMYLFGLHLHLSVASNSENLAINITRLISTPRTRSVFGWRILLGFQLVPFKAILYATCRNRHHEKYFSSLEIPLRINPVWHLYNRTKAFINSLNTKRHIKNYVSMSRLRFKLVQCTETVSALLLFISYILLYKCPVKNLVTILSCLDGRWRKSNLTVDIVSWNVKERKTAIYMESAAVFTV